MKLKQMWKELNKHEEVKSKPISKKEQQKEKILKGSLK